ncbi:MAG: transporter permease [Microbacteriaceae bacterium]|nr:transporter permease [Microbacteriaceae bacterium]
MSLSVKLPLDGNVGEVNRSNAASRTRSPVGTAGVFTYTILTALVIFALGPIVLFFFSALKTQNELASNPLGLPQTWQWGNFIDAWQQANMGAGLFNSVVIVGGTVILTCFVAGCAAYALARLEIRGGSAFITYLLVTSSLPTQMFLVPLFYLWSRAGLYDTQFGLILIYVGLFSPFATLLLRSFMLTMPKEFEEAARMDGAGELKILLRIVLPNALPGLLTIALVTGLSAYNEFLFAITFIQNSDLLPVSTTFFSFQQGFTQNFTLISAAGIIMIAPMLILFLALQRRFIDGLSSSGLGGA